MLGSHTTASSTVAALVRSSAPSLSSQVTIYGWSINFVGAHLTNLKGQALSGDNLIVEQNLLCSEGFTAKGEVRLAGAKIGGALSFNGAHLANANGLALNAPRITVEHDMLCQAGFRAEGNVSLRGAHIMGQLNFSSAHLANSKGPALTGDGLIVDSAMLCHANFKAQGEVRLPGARIAGVLSFIGACLTNVNGLALNADSVIVDQNMFCHGKFIAKGQTSLRGARIGGQLTFAAARLINPTGQALTADNLTVGQAMLCQEGFIAEGEVRLLGGHIGGQLAFVGAHLTNPSGRALSADLLTVNHSARCERLTAEGEVALPGARIGGELSFVGARLTNPTKRALDLRELRCGALFLRLQAAPDGMVDFTDAQVRTLADDEATWPAVLRLRGFSYDSLQEEPSIDVGSRLQWLEREQEGYVPQPYERLIAVYRQGGRDEDARKVAIAKRRRQRVELSWPQQRWGELLDLTVGYGYRTWLAGVWLLLLIRYGAWIFDLAYPARLTPREAARRAPFVSRRHLCPRLAIAYHRPRL
jgi:hypothetical protein